MPYRKILEERQRRIRGLFEISAAGALVAMGAWWLALWATLR